MPVAFLSGSGILTPVLRVFGEETHKGIETMATAFLKIENPGVAPAEAFTLLGASTKRDSDNSRNIGKFGSGNKHGVAVLLRNALPPIVFAGNLKMEFGTREQRVDTGLNTHKFARVQVKYGGKDAQGVSRTSTEDLGFVLEYGATDWLSVDLALREFVSNALDRAEEESDNEFNRKWQRENNITEENRNDYDTRTRFTEALTEYRKTAKPWQNVTIEVVNENQVRAKSGFTRVFVPLNNDVLNFFNNLGKWFLHFSEPEMLGKLILPKSNRNLGDRKSAVIYRRGVRVREFESSDTPSLFDYNLEHLELDESRKVDDWRVQAEAGRAVSRADSGTLARLMQSFLQGETVWEHQFNEWALAPSTYDASEAIAARKVQWSDAFQAVVGTDAVVATKNGGEMAKRKGYKVLEAPEAFVKAAEKWGIRTPDKVLTNDDKEGRTLSEATPDVLAAIDWIWDIAGRHNMLNGKEKPKASCYTKIMDGGSQSLGFYRDNTVFVNTDIAGGRSQQLLVTVTEEVAHHVTGATDNSRDFQDYLLNLLVKVALEKQVDLSWLAESLK